MVRWGNWYPTENCFVTTYHPSFMVHSWVLVHSGHLGTTPISLQVPLSCLSLQLLVATKNKQQCTIYRVEWCSICSLITTYFSVACLSPPKQIIQVQNLAVGKICVFPHHPRYIMPIHSHHSIQVIESRFNEKINKNPCFVSFWIS